MRFNTPLILQLSKPALNWNLCVCISSLLFQMATDHQKAWSHLYLISVLPTVKYEFKNFTDWIDMTSEARLNSTNAQHFHNCNGTGIWRNRTKHMVVRMEILFIFFQMVEGGHTLWNFPSKWKKSNFNLKKIVLMLGVLIYKFQNIFRESYKCTSREI